MARRKSIYDVVVNTRPGDPLPAGIIRAFPTRVFNPTRWHYPPTTSPER